ncbi:MAG: hypothetical protein RML93_08920 [Anaerolineales bacterium]|nr:hypothetical protein [Anaerolineales bacterium]MCS7248522.1 hypothetical protein [Anaerolineales bacterium]MDW8162335.1 hypothetical protein [Anaerolineales bacterium]MDW8447396.1 hypothetical protein [Anaerolineales bacterium]
MDVSPQKPKKLIALVLLLILLLGCNLLNTLQRGVEGAFATALAVATEAEGGREVLSTAQALVTQLVQGNLLETAQALATEVNQSGALATLEAVLTEQAPGLDKTLQAFLTQEVPNFQETARAALTPIPALSPTAPEDIPIIEGAKENFVLTRHTITYTVAMPYTEVVAFYKSEMPRRGWNYQADSSRELPNSSFLNYVKEGRTASISISFSPATQDTLVTIVLRSQ